MMEIYLNEGPSDNFKNHFKFIKSIASGGFGKVVHAIDLETNKEVAVKIIEPKIYTNIDSNKLNRIKQEINILQGLKHKNIIEFIDFKEINSSVCIIMELIKGGTLKSFLTNRNRNINEYLTEDECSILMKSLFQAVDYLHTKDIIHRDIKLDNIMLEDENDLTSVKLIDFGLSTYVIENNILKYDQCGTIMYMAPEQLDNKAYSKSIDMWSCGIIMFMLLNNGLHPLYEKEMIKINYINKLKAGNLKWNISGKKISKIAYSLLIKLIEINPRERYTVQMALNHPWITRNKLQAVPKPYFETFRIEGIKRIFKQVFLY
jgi:calcium/calmodulin-dependent protein kinase I